MTPTALSAAPALQRPSLALFGAEPWRATFEYLALRLRSEPPVVRGDGHPVLIFPGLGADAAIVAPLREHCERLGYRVFDWGRGRNAGPNGDVDQWLQKLADEVAVTLAPHRQRATLIGWSLGGLYARELGKLLAPRVRQVITMGTPFNADADADMTHAGLLYRCLNRDPATLPPGFNERLRQPPPVPTTSIYSRSDGIVAWQACCHGPECHGPQVEDIEVQGSHCGMAWNPAMLDLIAQRLARKPSAVRPARVQS